MDKMEVDDTVVDLSISSNNRPIPPPVYYHHPTHQQLAHPSHNNALLHQTYLASSSTLLGPPLSNGRRVLRPRTEPRSYVESPDVLINGARTNGILYDYSSGESSEGEMPPLAPIKELSTAELKHRERGLRRLREELRAEEMKLVLLKKLKQSQQLKENVTVLPPSIPASALPPQGLPTGLSITPTTVKMSSKGGPPPVGQPQARMGGSKVGTVVAGGASLMRVQQPMPPRHGSTSVPIIHGSTTLTATPRTSLSVPQPPQRPSMGRAPPPAGYPPGVKDLSPSVTITPAPAPQQQKTASGLDNKGLVHGGSMPSSIIQEERPREDNQTPAQRQAAAKLALRKQLEKTLLQIPPPKPPPPEMHFIPNPSNTEFIYLVGLEHVVDFLTKETKIPMPPQPFACSQCHSDFTPVWKWEISKKNKGVKSVICEQCVTNNVKKALKAEHTNRLKTAFVKALQQEQEIEQRLAQNGVFTSSSPSSSPVVTPDISHPKSVTPTPSSRHTAATPPTPTPPAPQPTPPPQIIQPQASISLAPPTSQPQQRQSQHGSSSSGHSSGSTGMQAQDKYVQQQSAAAMQALHQQLLRSLSAGAPPAAHMLQFSPLFYPYQLALAQAAASGKSSGGSPNLAEMQRAADLQRQYLLDMIPPPQRNHNWKT